MSRVADKITIYLDNAASTPVEPQVQQEMLKMLAFYGNPSSFNDIGRMARKQMGNARLKVARFIGAKPEEVIFTSSGSEANNLAIFGVTGAYSDLFRAVPKKQVQGEIITTPIEHPSVLEPLRVLSKKGWKITYLRVDRDGLVDTKDLEQKLNPRVALISIIYANNEIGTIQPIKKISKILNEFKRNKPKADSRKLIANEKFPIFHSDACQAAGYLDMNVNNLGVDLLTFNGTKIYGPRGIAVLYKKRGVSLKPLIYGGDQEYGLRAGTENLPAIAGLTKAISLIGKKEGGRLAELRDYFFKKIVEEMQGIKINGPSDGDRLPNNINISIPGLDSENPLLELDKYGIYASSGSACTARSVEPSHVLRAIGVEKKYLSGALRFSLGRQTTKKDIDYVLKILPKVVGELKKRYNKN